MFTTFPDSKVHVANMGPTWVLSAPYGPHVGPMKLAIRVVWPYEFMHESTYTNLLIYMSGVQSFYVDVAFPSTNTNMNSTFFSNIFGHWQNQT